MSSAGAAALIAADDEPAGEDLVVVLDWPLPILAILALVAVRIGSREGVAIALL